MNYTNKIKVLSILLAIGLGSQSWAQCTEDLVVDVSSMEICFGDELTLEASSALGGTITWDNDVVNGEAFIPVTAGNVTYTATSDNPDDCPFTVEVMVNELPEVAATADDIEVCVGQAVTLSGSGALFYSWDLGVVNGESFIPGSTTVYEVTGSDIKGCESTATIEVVVNALPTVEANADLTAVCIGGDLVLTGAGAATYVWADGIVDGEAFAPAATATYEVTGTDANGCVNTATIEVVVNSLPVVEANTDLTEVCAGAEVVLTGAGAVTYIWTEGVVNGEAFAPATTTTYEVTGTDANGCENTAAIEVVVNALPEVAIIADAVSICIGEDVTLMGAGAESYVWAHGIVDGEAFAPIETNMYEVSGTDANGCVNTADIEVVVNSLPTVEATADLTAVCIGGDLVLTGAGAATYVWADGIVDGEAFAPAATATYEVTGTDANGCVNTAAIEVVVNSLPVVEANTDLTEVCAGAEVVLTGAGAVTYIWTEGVVNGEAFAPATTTTYEVTGTDANGCENTAAIEVVVNALPEVAIIADAVSVCIGGDVTLTGAGAESYVWAGGVVNGEAFAPAATATYEVSGTDANGCENTATVEVIVNALPTVEATADLTAVCIGGDLVLTGVGAATYIWSDGIVDGEAFAPAATATYEVTGTDANGCVNTATIEVVVNSLPTVAANADVTEVCAGAEVVLTGAGAATYTWTDGIVDGEAFAPGATTTYEVTGTDVNGCENTATIEVIVNSPDVVANADVTAICIGGEVVLTGAGAESYVWAGGVVDGEAFAPAATATYEVTGTDANGCESTATVEVVVNALPTVEATADLTAVCIGGELVLTGAGAASYVWADGIVDGEAFAPAATATYEVTGTDANGCVNTATIEVVVNSLPTVEANADLTEVCAGAEVVLTGAGATSYTWTEGVVNGEAFAPAATTTFEVTGSDANGCENTASIEVIVNALPVVAIIADAEAICIGGDVTLTGAGAESYVWADGVVDGEAFAPVVTDTYEVIGTDAEGCVNTATIEVVVNALPTVEATADLTEVCSGTNITLTGAGATTYVWTEGVVDGEAFAPAATATYEVTGTDVNGCVNTATIEVVVNALPIVAAIADAEAVCIGSNVTLTGAGAESYDWTEGVVDGESFVPAATATYEVTGTDANGCVNTATIEVVVNALPEVIANANDLQICLGQELILTGAGAETYAWDLEVVDGEGFMPEVVGFVTYTVVGTDVNGCVNTSSVEVETRDSVQIIAVATDEFFGNDAVINIAVFGGYDSYVFDWDNDGTGDFDDTEDLADLAGGTYTVVVEDAAGCQATETVVISSQLSLEESKIEVGVYPNPTTDLVTVSTIGTFTYEVTTITGAIILNGVATNNEVIALGEYPTGVYFVAVKSANQTATVKVIKQ